MVSLMCRLFTVKIPFGTPRTLSHVDGLFSFAGTLVWSARLIGLCLACCLAACEEQQTPNAFRLATVQLHIKSNVLNTEVADTPLTSERGLMFRDSMPDDHGMLFIFDHPKTAAFWSRNTKIPLSIAYIDPAGKIVEIKSLRPFDETPVPSTSDQIAFALEVNEGWFSRHGVVTGTRIQGLPAAGSTHQ